MNSLLSRMDRDHISADSEPQPDTGCVYESTLQPSEYGGI